MIENSSQGEPVTKLMKSLELCNECRVCLDVCTTYKATQNEGFSPIGRIKAARKIFQDEEVTPDMIEVIYNCPECYLCTGVCPFDIDVPEIAEQSRAELVRKGLGRPQAARGYRL